MQVLLDIYIEFSQAACHQLALHLSVSQSARDVRGFGASYAMARLTCTVFHERTKQTKDDTDKHDYHQSVTMPPAGGLHY